MASQFLNIKILDKVKLAKIKSNCRLLTISLPLKYS